MENYFMEMLAGLTVPEFISMLSSMDVYQVVFTPHHVLSNKEYTLWVIAKALCHRIALLKKQEEEDINACSDITDEIIVSLLTPYSEHVNTHHQILACFLSNRTRCINRLVEVVEEELGEEEQELVRRYKSLFPIRSIPLHWEHVKYVNIDQLTFSVALMSAYHQDYETDDDEE